MEFKTKKPLFGKYVEITLFDIEKQLAEEIVETTYKEGLRLSKIFNFYDDNSELSQLNQKRKLKVSKELLEVIKIAKEFSSLNKYDISLGKIFKSIKNKETPKKISCSFKDISLNGDEIILENSDVEIDLGSIAKGYIVDKIVENLKSQGVVSGFVNGRGDIRVFGKSIEIGIQHPREKEKLIASINLKNSSVATSGDYNQYNENFDNCHIVNKKELISVTVISKTLTLADVFATIIFVSDDIEKILEKHKEIKVMTIDKNLNVKYYNDFEKFLIK